MSKIGENMILGVGIDIIEIARVERALQRRKNLLRRLFTQSEIAYCLDRKRPGASLAARFAAKEAVRKACSLAIPGKAIPWLDMEIDMEKGHPIVKFLGDTAQKAVANGVRNVFVSMSHSKEYACASLVLSGDQ